MSALAAATLAPAGFKARGSSSSSSSKHHNNRSTTTLRAAPSSSSSTISASSVSPSTRGPSPRYPTSSTASSPAIVTTAADAAASPAITADIRPTLPAPAEVTEKFWEWEGHTIRYQMSGTEGPAMILVHGFGGNADHWRKNTPVLGRKGRVFAIDLLGYGYSSKPNPLTAPQNSVYNFETWARQLHAFIDQIIGEASGGYIIHLSFGANE